MKYLLCGLAMLVTMSAARADFDFFDNNSGKWVMGPYGPYYEESNWPKWTPMYWMEEMFDSFDDNEYGYNNGFQHGYNRNFNYVTPYALNAYPPTPYMMPPMQPYPYAPPMINQIPMQAYSYSFVPPPYPAP